ncbi:C2H2 transcription factor [Apiospora rasikravindrae]|uniref:C2H2 transcription factor n=1 Tax=Apiospora rasikravindrae TaxID=990691 RepID=A0ABR1SJX4_9PEZI
MQSIQSVETATISGNADDIAEGKQQKPKTLPCKYCSKRFRDLLVRHEKLVHLNEGTNKDGVRPRKSSIAGAVDQQQMPPENHVGNEMMSIPRAHAQQYHSESIASVSVPTLAPDPRQPGRAAACNLDLLSDAATQIASANEVSSIPPMMGDMGQTPNGISRMKPYDDGLAYGDRGRESQDAAAAAIPVGFPGQGTSSAYEDYNLFLDDFASSSHFLPQAFETDQSPSMWPRHPTDLQRGASKPTSQFPSRFPSLQPDIRDASDAGGRGHEDSMRAPPLRVSAMDHTVLKSRLEEFSSILPNDFIFPSRHTLTRFLEGYVSGFHDHLPILHLPTISVVDLSPELLLAILAVGAQYRFENHRGNALWYAAKAVAMEQIRRRHSHEVHGLLPTPAAYSPHSTRPSPSHGFRHSFSSVQQERSMTQETHREPYSPNTPQSRMETIQALLLLFAVGLWGAKAILHEAMSLQSLLALLVREEGFTADSTQTADWEAWIRIEGANRTKLIVYCFFNLCSIAYNMPPLLLTSELNIFLPHSSKLWRAESAWQWQEARHAFSSMDISLQDAFSRLFSRPPQGPALYMSALGNYGLIHAVLQHIFLLKQTCFSSVPSFETPRGLRPDDVEEVAQALRMWQMSFEQHQSRAAEMNPQNGNESFAGGPVAYNSTALWRLASIRLYTDLSPSRTLETREAGQIATAFHDAPYLNRSVRLNRAVLQAIHALSMLVKLGVNYVARRKSTEWSIQHSFCNLECAILLSKWLMTLASIGPSDPPASPEERNLLEMLRRMLDETEFAVPIDPSLSGSASGHPPHVDYTANDSTKLRQLAAAVTRLWAETFKGNHMFDIVKVIGNGLEGYADLLEKPRDRTPIGRLPLNGGLG